LYIALELFKCLSLSEVGKRRVIIDFVLPTVARPTLWPLVTSLLADAPAGARVIVVDDRRGTPRPLELRGATVVRGDGRGPAAARNTGWRSGTAEWVAFLDDDVVLTPGWAAQLVADIGTAAPDVAATFGRVSVPLPRHRRPTDWERNVARLEGARWVTADAAYRRAALDEVGGFDERFVRAYREDADLALRVIAAGWRLEVGQRRVLHPVRPAPWWVSVGLQAGNADDALMRAVHGAGWRARAGAPRGRLPAHLALTAAALAAVGAAVTRRAALARAFAVAWAAGTVEFTARRVAPGPRTAREVAAMGATSALIPFAATGQWARGWARVPAQLRRGGPSRSRRRVPAAVLFDRDGTLVEDVPYNGDPSRVAPMPGAREALEQLRRRGIPTAVVSNQSGIGRGYVTWEQVEAVNRRVEDLLGPLGPFEVCPHTPEDACGCRKPLPGLVQRAVARLDVRAEDVVVIGDIGPDVDAAEACGATGVLVPTERTRAEERARARHVAATLRDAIELVLDGELT